MGTRGFVGFAVDGENKIIYNHFDSYPGGLGVHMLSWLRGRLVESDLGVRGLRQQVSDLRMVTHDDPVTDEDVDTLGCFHDGSVSTGDSREWYALLRHTQGDPEMILEAGVAEDASGFPKDSLFCEWGYLVDLDEEWFEVYTGFQTESHTDGRFAHLPPRDDRYYPVRLVARWPFDQLPDTDEFIKELEEEEKT